MRREDWKGRVPYTLDSSTRYSFQKPDQTQELKGQTTRYGSNKQKHVSALGVGEYFVAMETNHATLWCGHMTEDSLYCTNILVTYSYG